VSFRVNIFKQILIINIYKPIDSGLTSLLLELMDTIKWQTEMNESNSGAEEVQQSSRVVISEQTLMSTANQTQSQTDMSVNNQLNEDSTQQSFTSVTIDDQFAEHNTEPQSPQMSPQNQMPIENDLQTTHGNALNETIAVIEIDNQENERNNCVDVNTL
jgi:thymidine kinase